MGFRKKTKNVALEECVSKLQVEAENIANEMFDTLVEEKNTNNAMKKDALEVVLTEERVCVVIKNKCIFEKTYSADVYHIVARAIDNNLKKLGYIEQVKSLAFTSDLLKRVYYCA